MEKKIHWRKKFLRKLGIIFIPTLIFWVMRFLWLSYRKRYHFINKPIEGQCIAVTWHGELFISPQVYRKLRKDQPTSAIISQHFNGELIAKTLGLFKIKGLRGSSKRGAKSVLISAIKAIKNGETIMITPDGPRGPKKSMSDGAVALALRSKLPIMVVNYQPNTYWQLKSWDGFLIPKPFSKIDIYHKIIQLDRMEREEAKKYLQAEMNRDSL